MTIRILVGTSDGETVRNIINVHRLSQELSHSHQSSTNYMNSTADCDINIFISFIRKRVHLSGRFPIA